MQISRSTTLHTPSSHYFKLMSFFKSTIWLIAAEIVFTLSGYVINAGLGRMLGPADFGRYSLVIGFTTMAITLIGRGIPSAMAKRLSENLTDAAQTKAVARTAAILQTGLVLALTAVFYFAAPLTARAFGDLSLTPLFQLTALVIPAFSLSSFHVLLFNGLKRFDAMTAMKMSRGILRMAWILGLTWYFGLTGALTGAIIAPLCVFGVAMIIDTIWPLHGRTDASKASDALQETTSSKLFPYPPKNILNYAGGFMLFTLFYEFYVRTDIYLIKAVLGSDYMTGIYNAAMTVALIPYYLFFALAFILFPTISQHTKNGISDRASRIVSTVLRFVFLFLLPVAALMVVFAKPLVTLFFGFTFAPSAALVPLMIGGTLFGTFFYVLAAVFNGAGYTRITALITGLAIAISVPINIMFLLEGGIAIAALTFSATSLFMGAMSLVSAHAIFDARIPWRTVLRALVATSAMTYVALLIDSHMHFIIAVVVSLGLYVALLVALRELTHADLALIKKK